MTNAERNGQNLEGNLEFGDRGFDTGTDKRMKPPRNHPLELSGLFIF